MTIAIALAAALIAFVAWQNGQFPRQWKLRHFFGITAFVAVLAWLAKLEFGGLAN